MTDGQVMGLGTLMAIGAVIVGYVVYALMPEKHFPIVAGVLAANAVMGGLAVAGLDPASDILLYFLAATGILAWIAAHTL